MIKILTGTQMKSVDKKAIEDLKIPSVLLMENAGRSIAETVIEVIEENEITPEIVIICGKGNNGGDGFVAARHLIESEIDVYVVSVFRETELSDDALINHNILKHFTDIVYFDELGLEDLEEIISTSGIVVDALLGTGISSEVKGEALEIIQAINEYAEEIVISVDIPSGINSDTGEILGSAVVADYTTTFCAPKLGSIIYPGADYTGEIIISDIGIPKYLLNEPEHNINLITRQYVSASLPLRPTDSNKGTFGSVFNVAGSFTMSGAAYMSAISSLKSGAGYSILAAPESIISTLAVMTPEIVYVPLKETANKAISFEAVNEALDKSKKCNSFLIGPGIGTHPSTVEFVFEFLKELIDRNLNCVIDADGLNCLSERDNFVLPLNSIITPHPKELARLLKIPMEEILDNRVKAVREAAYKFNTIVVLKGARTLIAEPDGSVYVNSTGNTALATAGSGDVLAGMISGFIAQGVSIKDSAILGVYLHGLAGDLASVDLTEAGVTASKLIDYVPLALKKAMI